MAATRKKPARTRTNRTPVRPNGEDWAAAFLQEFAACGVVGRAAKVARVGRTTVYDRLNSDPDFAAAFNVAGEDAADDMEDVARRRARAKSDRLMMYFLNLRYRPPTERKRGKLHLHLHQHVHQEQLRQKYEAMPDDELHRKYQEQIESKLAVGAEAGTPPDGAGPMPT